MDITAFSLEKIQRQILKVALEQSAPCFDIATSKASGTVQLEPYEFYENYFPFTSSVKRMPHP